MNTIFLNNKYTKYYHRVVTSAQEKKRKRGRGIARHHIIPAHFYIDNKRKEKDEAALTKGWLLGDPDEKSNLVYLTHREHLICHLLLGKMIEEEKRAGCIYAAWRMVNYELEDGSVIKCNSRLYDKIRTEVAETHSKTMKGRTAHNKGKKVTDKEALDNIKEAAQKRDANKKTCEHCDRIFTPSSYKQYHGDKCEKNPNRDLSIVTVKTRGQKRTEEQKANLSRGQTGIKKGPMSQAEKDKRSKSAKGKKKPLGHTEKRMATLAKQLEEGTHYSQRRISCVETRKEYSVSTFNRYVIKRLPGARTKVK